MENHFIIENIDGETNLVTVKELGASVSRTFKVDDELLDSLYLLAKDAEENEEPAIVLMNEKNQFIL